jgi:hypothetical protein
MKDQYVADINDYVKYSVLRAVQRVHTTSLLVCWMLTEDDGGKDGRRTSYLAEAGRYRSVDPQLFDALTDILRSGVRSTRAVEAAAILSGATFFRRRLTDERQTRERLLRAMWRQAEGRRVIFFDPDNGLDVPSVRLGRLGSRRYVYCHELAPLRDHGTAGIIYQHFPRVDRKTYVAQQLDRLGQALPGFATFAAHSASIAFLVATPPAQRVGLQAALRLAQRRWDGRLVLTGT